MRLLLACSFCFLTSCSLLPKFLVLTEEIIEEDLEQLEKIELKRMEAHHDA